VGQAGLEQSPVAEVCGLGSAANLRWHFGRVVGTSPTAYRKAFKQRASDDVQPAALGLRVS
jgi:transcriptional regulator GlxA family with amidase domain